MTGFPACPSKARVVIVCPPLPVSVTIACIMSHQKCVIVGWVVPVTPGESDTAQLRVFFSLRVASACNIVLLLVDVLASQTSDFSFSIKRKAHVRHPQAQIPNFFSFQSFLVGLWSCSTLIVSLLGVLYSFKWLAYLLYKIPGNNCSFYTPSRLVCNHVLFSPTLLYTTE